MKPQLLRGVAPSDENGDRADRVLTVADVDAIVEATARRVVEIVAPTAATAFALVGARELAHELGVSLDYVYSHATELSGMRLGSGRRARIRFDLGQARRALETHVSPRGADAVDRSVAQAALRLVAVLSRRPHSARLPVKEPRGLCHYGVTA
jgi:hypothetical protein